MESSGSYDGYIFGNSKNSLIRPHMSIPQVQNLSTGSHFCFTYISTNSPTCSKTILESNPRLNVSSINSILFLKFNLKYYNMHQAFGKKSIKN